MSHILKFARELDQIVRRFGATEDIYFDDALQHDPVNRLAINKESEVVRGHKDNVLTRPEGSTKAD